jgi:hypothetical protein
MSLGQRALWGAVAVLLVTQGATAYGLYRFAVARPAATDPPRTTATPAPRLPARAPTWLAARPPGSAGDAAPAGSVPTRTPMPLVKQAAPRPAWSARPLDDAGARLAGELGCSPDDLRLFADGHGGVTEAARRDLLAGRDAGMKIARDLGIEDERAEALGHDVLEHMIRRVTMRASFQGTAVTGEAIDEAVQKDTLASVQGTYDDRVRDAVAAALPGLPDLTRDALPASP